MNRINLLDGTYLKFEQGNKDPWCVYIVSQNGTCEPPYDKDYFSELLDLSNKYGDKIYNDFVKIYDLTTKDFEENVVKLINEISASYKEDEKLVQKVFSLLYMTMISEFHYVSKNGQPSKLKKRIKRFAIHLILKEKKDIDYAISLTYQSAVVIDSMCKEWGF